MKENLIKLWSKLLNIGMSDELSYINRVRLKILNQQGFYVVLIVFLFIIKTLAEGEEDIWILFIILLTSSFILVLNYWKKHLAAKLYWTVFYPSLMMGVIVLYGEAIHGEATFFIFMVTVLIFFSENWIRTFLIIFTITLFLFSIYYTNNYESPFAEITDEIDKVLFFSVTVLCISAIIVTFSGELLRHIKELESNNIDLSNAYKEIERFAYISSHNLKTPIRTIRSFTDLMARDLNRKKTENLPEYLDFVKQGAEQMQFLIIDILEYSKLNQDKGIQIEAVNLNKTIDFIQMQIQSFSEKSIEIKTDKLPTIQSNQTLINSIFQNLIENGIKYNDSKQILITISIRTTEDTHILTFEDNGIGIAKEYHEKIFNMFERLHSNPKYEGTGIGLAMRKKIVEKLGGKISVDSEEGKGAKFYLELPIEPKVMF